jgi:excisionase family DNA binding protein
MENNKSNKEITFENMPQAVAKVNEALSTVLTLIEDIKKNFEPKQPTELLTREEMSNLLKCDLSTIHNWTKKGKLHAYGIGNRVYYKRSEVEASLVSFGKKS